MAKKSMIARNEKRQKLVKKYLKRRKELKKQIKFAPNFDTKLRLNFKLQKLPRNSAPVRVNSCCLITGRSKGCYSYFGLSRHVLREMAYAGLLPGVTKSSW